MGSLATNAEAIAGSDPRLVMSPASLQAVMDVSRDSFSHYENLGIKYVAGTFSVCAANGSDLSATNYAKLTLPSNVQAGTIVRHTLIANQSFIDATGASTIIGNVMGTTVAKAWPEQMPMFIYCAPKSDDTTPVFFISRIPNMSYIPPTAKIGYSGTPAASTAGSVFALQVIDGNDYQGCPAVLMGSFRMASKSALEDWTVAGLDRTDGFGLYRDNQGFNMPYNQFGATSLIIEGAGTSPTFGIQESLGYNVQRSGMCGIQLILVNFGGGTPASGANDVEVVCPLPASTQFPAAAVFWANGADFLTADKSMELAQAIGSPLPGVIKFSPGTAGAFFLTLNDLSGDVRLLSGTFSYPIGTD
jgi:hypothetical protein